MKIRLLLSGVALALITACTAQSAAPNISPLSSPVNAGYKFPRAVAATQADKGVITGQLINRATGKPIAKALLHAAYLLPLNPGPGYLINVDPKSAPQTTTDEQGYFAIENIPPNRYALLIWTPDRAHFVSEEANANKELVVEVAAGKVNDIGAVKITPP
jgi:hypothetical protein